MNQNIIISIGFHGLMIILTALSLPLMKRKAIDLPAIVSVELIEISDLTNIPFAPKAAELIKKIKEKQRVVSEQAPPAKKKKEKPERIPLPDDLQKQKKKIVKKKTKS